MVTTTNFSAGTGPRGPQSSWGTSGSPTGGALSGSQLSNFTSGGTGPRGPASSWGTSGSPTGGSLTGGQLSNYNGGMNSGGNSGGSGTGPRGPESSWGTSGGVSGGALSGSQLSNFSNAGGNIGGALNAGLGGSYTPAVPGGLRGVTGPLGEPRIQPTPYGTNYQTAQLYRAAYPGSVGQYDQTRVTNALNQLSKALPGEADYNRYGTGAMNNLARVGLNQIVGGYSPEKMVAGMDTTGMRPATRGYSVPGPNSIGMTDNWSNPVQGAAYEALAANSIREALLNQGVSPIARNASNFVAAGTRMVPGVRSIGEPVYGTQFGSDPTWGNRIANRNAAAVGSPALASLDDRSIGGPLSDPASTGALNDPNNFDAIRQAGRQELADLNTRMATEIPGPINITPRVPVFADMSAAPVVPQAPFQQPLIPRTPTPAPVLTKEFYDRIEPTEDTAVAQTAASKDQERLLDVGSPVEAPVYTPGRGPVLSLAEVQPPLSRTPTQAPQYRTYTEPLGPFRMSPGRATVTKTLVNTPASLAPVVGPINTVLGLFGNSLGDMAVWDQNRIMNMTGPERAAYDAERAQMAASGASFPGAKGGDNKTPTGGGNEKPTDKDTQTSNTDSKSDQGWKADALAYGYSAEQLKDPEIAALVKQLWDMGFIPKTSSA